MKTQIKLLLITVLLLFWTVNIQGETLSLVPTIPVVLQNGDTIDITIDVERFNPSIMFITQTLRSGDPTHSWVLTTQIIPDNTGDDIPEVLATYVAPVQPNPFDVNQDGVVDGGDFWALFVFIFYTP